MSNNKKTQKKQAEPNKFTILSIEERNNMSLDELEEHYTHYLKKQSNYYERYKTIQTYNKYTTQILEVKRQIEIEKEWRSK